MVDSAVNMMNSSFSSKKSWCNFPPNRSNDLYLFFFLVNSSMDWAHRSYLCRIRLSSSQLCVQNYRYAGGGVIFGCSKDWQHWILSIFRHNNGLGKSKIPASKCSIGGYFSRAGNSLIAFPIESPVFCPIMSE